MEKKVRVFGRSSINKRLNYRYVPTLATGACRTGATHKLQNVLRVLSSYLGIYVF